MPLVRFELKNEYGLGDPELYRGPAKREDPKTLLDGVAVAGLVGILRQLGDLAEFAADVFHDLHEQVMTTAARGHKVSNRIQQIEEALPSLEKAIQAQRSHIHFAYVAGAEWHANPRTDQSHILSSDLPRFMLDSYEECRDPPRLYLLDKFDMGGNGSCLKRYSDPSYFKHAWFASESEKPEKVPREKKHLKNKTRGSRIRNMEVQHGIPMSRHNSRSTQFASPSIDGLDFSNEHVSLSDTGLKPEYESVTTSSDSKTRLSFVEQSLDTNPSLVPDEAELDILSVSKLPINHNDSCSSTPIVDTTGNAADDDSQHNSLEGSVHRSPSVTWDEKTEIVKPASPPKCDNVLVDMVLDSEALPETSGPSNLNLETAEFVVSEQDDILLDIPSRQLSVSAANHFDEVTSETDNYMDALNTLDSETETDSECQTKREVTLPNFGSQTMESGTEDMHGVSAIASDSSDVETPMASHMPLSKDVPPDSPESSEHIQEGLQAAIVPDLHISAGNDGYQNVSGMSRMNIAEGSKDGPSADSRIPDLQTVFVDENTGCGSKSVDSPLDTSSAPVTKLWTNGGLLGLEPSKPPDLSALNRSSESALSGSKGMACDSSSHTTNTKLYNGESSGKSVVEVAQNKNMSRKNGYLENVDDSPNTLSSVDRSSLNSDQLFGIIYNAVEANSSSMYSPSRCQQDDISANQNSRKSIEASSFGHFKKTRDTCDSLYSDNARHDQKGPNNVPGPRLADAQNIELQPNESDQNTNGFSSSFSELAQRFLANSLQRRVPYTPVDISIPSAVNTDVRSHETSVQNKPRDGPAEVISQIPNRQEKFEHGSLKKSVSSGSCYSENSSPPLEHMKISFHPMNGSETSKLRLEFPNVSLHESMEDLTFPSFQLIPGPTLPVADTGSESDDDTFCRSSAYSSEDIHSPRSYSNSELWEHDERGGSKDSETYDDLRRVSSSTASSSSFMEFEQINHCRTDSANGSKNFEIIDGTLSPHSGPIADLPDLDSVIFLKDEQGQRNSLSVDHANSEIQPPEELPPPPPLPPMQWRLMKPSFASEEVKGSSTPATVEHFTDPQARRIVGAQQLEQTVPGPPSIAEAMVAHLNMKTVQEKQKVNGNREASYGVNGNKVDEREELLYQIRNKAFNLRRIAPSKPSVIQQPTTNVNVVAILEKANAIRQACVGSDEGGDDDDNWSNC